MFAIARRGSVDDHLRCVEWREQRGRRVRRIESRRHRLPRPFRRRPVGRRDRPLRHHGFRLPRARPRSGQADSGRASGDVRRRRPPGRHSPGRPRRRHRHAHGAGTRGCPVIGSLPPAAGSADMAHFCTSNATCSELKGSMSGSLVCAGLHEVRWPGQEPASHVRGPDRATPVPGPAV